MGDTTPLGKSSLSSIENPKSRAIIIEEYLDTLLFS